MKLCGIEIGPDQPTRFIAELSNNHNGSWTLMRRLMDAAKAAGADFVKTQCYTADELVALRGDAPAPEPWGGQGYTMRSLYEKAATPREFFPAIRDYGAQIGMPWFSSVFGSESLALLESLDCPAYKLASLDAGAVALREAVDATGKPIIRSLPKNEMRKFPRWPETLHLLCPPGYPQQEHLLRDIRDFGFDGYSYHGISPAVPVLAAAYGAQLIECHLMLSDAPSELEANVSLDEAQFKVMVDAVRANERLAA